MYLLRGRVAPGTGDATVGCWAVLPEEAGSNGTSDFADTAIARLFLFSSKCRSTASRLSFLTSFFSWRISSFTAPVLLRLKNLFKLSVFRFMAVGVWRFYWPAVRRLHQYPYPGSFEVLH